MAGGSVSLRSEPAIAEACLRRLALLLKRLMVFLSGLLRECSHWNESEGMAVSHLYLIPKIIESHTGFGKVGFPI